MQYKMSVYALAISLTLTASLAQASPTSSSFTQTGPLDDGRASEQSLFVLEEIGNAPNRELLSQQTNFNVRPASVGNARVIERSAPSNGNTRLDLRPSGQPLSTFGTTTNSRPNTPASNNQSTPQVDSAPTIGSSDRNQPGTQQVPDARINSKSTDITCNYKPSPTNNIPGTKTGDITCDLKPSYREGISTYADGNGNSLKSPGGEAKNGEWRPIVVPPGASGQMSGLKPDTNNASYGVNGTPINPGGNAETGEWRPIVVPPGSSGSGGNFSSPKDNASYGVVGYPISPGGNVETGEWRPIVVPPGSTGPTGYEANTGKGQTQLQCDAHPTTKGRSQITCNGAPPKGKGQAQIQCNGFHPTGKGQAQIQCNAHPIGKGQAQIQCDAHPSAKGQAQFQCNAYPTGKGQVQFQCDAHPTDSKTMAPASKIGNPASAIQLQCNEKGTGIVICNAHPKTGTNIPVMGAGNNEVPQVQLPNQKGTGIVACNFHPKENTPAIPMIDANNNAIPQIQMPNEKGTGLVLCNAYPINDMPLIPVMDAGHHDIPQIQMPNGAFEGKGLEMSPGGFEGKGGGEFMHDPGFTK